MSDQLLNASSIFDIAQKAKEEISSKELLGREKYFSDIYERILAEAKEGKTAYAFSVFNDSDLFMYCVEKFEQLQFTLNTEDKETVQVCYLTCKPHKPKQTREHVKFEEEIWPFVKSNLRAGVYSFLLPKIYEKDFFDYCIKRLEDMAFSCTIHEPKWNPGGGDYSGGHPGNGDYTVYGAYVIASGDFAALYALGER